MTDELGIVPHLGDGVTRQTGWCVVRRAMAER